MSVEFYEVIENKYLSDDYKLIFEVEKCSFSEDADGLILSAKEENFINMNVSAKDLINLKTELTLLENDSIFKRGLPKLVLVDYKVDSFSKDVKLFFKPVGEKEYINN